MSDSVAASFSPVRALARAIFVMIGRTRCGSLCQTTPSGITAECSHPPPPNHPPPRFPLPWKLTLLPLCLCVCTSVSCNPYVYHPGTRPLASLNSTPPPALSLFLSLSLSPRRLLRGSLGSLLSAKCRDDSV